uniref:Protein ECM11 n=1 Tax=Parastrongyloides trichosuri TaxID=131310 RepID=A0A0N5A015_PARTI
MERDNEVFLKQTPPVSPLRNSPSFNTNNIITTPCSLIDSGVFGSELDKASNRSISDSDSMHSSIYNSNQHSPTHGTTWREIDAKKTSKRDPLTTSVYQNFLNIPELSSTTVKTIIPMEDDTSSETSAQICEDEQNLLSDGNETLTLNPSMDTSYHWDEYIPSNNWNDEAGFEINDIMGMSFHNEFDLFNYSSNLNESLPFIEEEEGTDSCVQDTTTAKKTSLVPNIFKLILSPLTSYLFSDNNIIDDISLLSSTKNRHLKGSKKCITEESQYKKLYQFSKEHFNNHKMNIILGGKDDSIEVREKLFEKLVMKLHQYQRKINQDLHDNEELWKGNKGIAKLNELGELVQFKILINALATNEKLKIKKEMFPEDKISTIAEDWYDRMFLLSPMDTFLNINLCKVIMKDIINKQKKNIGKSNKNNDNLKTQFLLLKQIYDLHYSNIPLNNSKDSHSAIPSEDLEVLRKFLNNNFQHFSIPGYYPPFVASDNSNRSKEFWWSITKNACVSLFFGISFLLLTALYNSWSYQGCCQDNNSNGWVFGLTLKKNGDGVPPV